MHKQSLLILVGVVIATMYPLFLGHFYLSGDMLTVFAPLEKFFHDELLAGRMPAWLPDAAWGFPVIASAQIGFFYPPLLLLRLFPFPWYLSVAFAFHLLLAATGMYALLRRLQISHMATVLGSLTFTLSGWLIQHTTHLNIIITVAWLPLQLLAAHYAASANNRRAWALLALVLGLPFLAGQIQLPTLMAVIAMLYAITLAWKHGKLGRLFLITWLVAFGAAGIAAVQLLPTYELVQHSTRGVHGSFDLAQANQFSWPLYHVPTILFPRFFGTDDNYWGKRLEIEYGFFVGTVPLMLALWVVAYQKHKTRSLFFFLALALASFLLALGGSSPFRLLGLEPSLWVFTAPARWLAFTTLAGSILAAYGFDLASRNRAAFTRYLTNVAGVVAVMVIFANGVIWSLPNNFPHIAYNWLAENTSSLVTAKPAAYYIDKLAQLQTSLQTTSVSFASPYTYLPLLALGLPLLLRNYSLRRTLLVVTIAELCLVAVTTSPTASWSNLHQPDTVSQLPTAVQQGQERLFSQLYGGDSGAVLTNPETRADAEYRDQQHQLLKPLINTMYGIPGVEWPASLYLQQQGDVLANLAQAEDLNIGAIATIDEENGDFVIRDLDAVPRAEITTTDGRTPATYRSLEPTIVAIDYEANKKASLIVRDTWFPGWHASINGQEIYIQPAGFFRQVIVPAGRHTVFMQYQSTYLSMGLLISIMSLIIIGFITMRPKVEHGDRTAMD